MPREQAYLIRGSDGRMRTVMGTSERAAIKTFLRKYRPSRGDLFNVKLRGHGDWQEYRVS